MDHGNFLALDSLTDEVVLNVNVFRSRVEGVVLHERLRAVVIAEDGGWLGNGIDDLANDRSEPNGFLHCMGECHILGLSGGQRDDGLLLR